MKLRNGIVTAVMVALVSGMGAAGQPWHGGDKGDKGDRRPDRDGRDRERLPEGSYWEGSRTTQEDKYKIEARIVSRTKDEMVLKTKEDDGPTLEWTFAVKDTSLKLKSLVKTGKAESHRQEPWAIGEVRGEEMNLDYGWRLVEGKGKGQKVEGKLKLKRG